MPTSMHDRARLDPVALHELRLADAGDDDVGLTHERREDRASPSGRWSRCSAPSTARAPSAGPTMFDWPMTTACMPTRSSPVSLSSRMQPIRRARPQHGHLEHEASDVVRVEAVDVLPGIDALDDALGIDVLGQRQLHEDRVHLRIGIEAVDEREKLRFAGVRRAGRARTIACRPLPSSCACCARRPAMPRSRRPARPRVRAQDGPQRRMPRRRRALHP